MKIIRTNRWVDEGNNWLKKKARMYEAQKVYLSAGETMRPLFADWRASVPPMLNTLELYQVDEIIEGEREGVFARFFHDEIPMLRVSPPRTYVQADLAILGLGMNGHVALHEPGTPLQFRFGEVCVCADTSRRLGVAKKTRARTYGIGAFLDTCAVLLIVTGLHKKRILRAVLDGDHPTLPATALLKHNDVTVLADPDAM